MTILSLEQLLEIHALAIEATGGSMGIRDLGKLESAIASQTQDVFGQELYPSVVDKAAALIRSIVADHAFVDSNKRTSMLAGLTLLQINGITFKIRAGELEGFAVKVAIDKLDAPIIAEWLQKHS